MKKLQQISFLATVSMTMTIGITKVMEVEVAEWECTTELVLNCCTMFLKVSDANV